MKRKNIFLIAAAILLLSIGGAYILIKEQSKLVLVLKEDSLKLKPYSFLEKKSLTALIDEEKSQYESLEIMMLIDDKEYKINDELKTIYDLYQIDLKDEEKIPVGEKAKIKLRANKGKKTLEKEIKLDIEELSDYIVQSQDGKEFKEKYEVEFGANIENLKKPKVLVNYFGQYNKEIKSELETKADTNKAGEYALVINIPDLDKSIQSTIHVKEKVNEEPPANDSDGKKPETNKPPKPKPAQAADLSKLTVLVNKKYHLKRNDEPALTTFPEYYAVDSGYRAQAVAVKAFIELVDTMESETGMSLRVTSSYRPYSSQERLFNNYVAKNGLEQAMKFSARPGESEHQTGLAIDVVKRGAEGSMFEFGNTKESVWLADNAHRFGFIIRYPKGKEAITGYQYEAWHIRYLGKELATKVKTSGLTYDEYWETYLR